MMIELFDDVVYTPLIENLEIAEKRRWDWCLVVGISNSYFDVEFINGSVYSILKEAITLSPYSEKTIRNNFSPSLNILKNAVEAREARQLMLQKTNISVRKPGPADIIQQFITSEKRCKFIL